MCFNKNIEIGRTFVLVIENASEVRLLVVQCLWNVPEFEKDAEKVPQKIQKNLNSYFPILIWIQSSIFHYVWVFVPWRNAYSPYCLLCILVSGWVQLYRGGVFIESYLFPILHQNLLQQTYKFESGGSMVRQNVQLE